VIHYLIQFIIASNNKVSGGQQPLFYDGLNNAFAQEFEVSLRTKDDIVGMSGSADKVTVAHDA
jgi:hypothetical protein